jgi:hypothetical protein
VLLTAAEKPEQAANGCWPLLFLRKGAFGDTIVVTVFTFIAIPTAGFASLGHEFTILGAIKFDFLVLFHFFILLSVAGVHRRRFQLCGPPST